MRAIDADKLYEYLDEEAYYPHESFAKIEDVLKIIENQPELKAIVIPPNATNGDVMMMIFKEIQHYSDGKICASWWNAIYNKQQEEVKESSLYGVEYFKYGKQKTKERNSF